jgi:hypothetical protein
MSARRKPPDNAVKQLELVTPVSGDNQCIQPLSFILPPTTR